jgi:5-carboxymethyl-2-hydroxymuconate isomerase
LVVRPDGVEAVVPGNPVVGLEGFGACRARPAATGPWPRERVVQGYRRVRAREELVEATTLVARSGLSQSSNVTGSGGTASFGRRHARRISTEPPENQLMPHLVLDCSPKVLAVRSGEELVREVHDTAAASGLFANGDIKVRIRTSFHYTVGDTQDDFIHVFGYVMEGRTVDERKALSMSIVKRLKDLLPDVPVISMNVIEFEKATYTNRTMV